MAVAACMSCSKSDDAPISGTGNLGVEFDNAFKADDLILNTQENQTSFGETLKISGIRYIISNIVLTNENGTTFTYPKSSSYFIVDEANEAMHVLELQNVPAGNYTKIKFGVGVDQAQYDLGEASQGDFLTQAINGGLLLNWDEGYHSLWLEGLFISPTVTSPTAFSIETRKTADQYNYTEITLDLPTQALVRTNISPEIHIIADLSKIVDGTNKVHLSDHVSGGEANVFDDNTINQIVANFQQMFTVAHVHND